MRSQAVQRRLPSRATYHGAADMPLVIYVIMSVRMFGVHIIEVPKNAPTTRRMRREYSSEYSVNHDNDITMSSGCNFSTRLIAAVSQYKSDLPYRTTN